MVRRGNDKAVARELFDERQKAVQQPAHLTHIAREITGVADAVKLLEQIHRSCAIHRFKDHPQLGK